MNLSVGAKTDPGRRPNNEDQLAVVDVRRLRLRADSVLVIADGMGGRNFGERAASAAVEAVQETLIEMLQADRAEQVDVRDALDSALRKANARVYEVAGQAEESRGMGTTLVAAVVEGDRLYLAHAGDSRAYLLRGHQLVAFDGRSFLRGRTGTGRNTFRGKRPTFSLSECDHARCRHRTDHYSDLGEHDVQVGDCLLLCTDGLSNMVDEAEMEHMLSHASSAQDAADRLVQTANRNGGRDNITAIVARLEAGNRTQRMRKSDLAQVKEDERDNGVPADAETPTVPPRSSGATTPPLFTPPRFVTSRPPSRGSIAAIIVLSLLSLVLLAGGLALAHVLSHDGYAFQATPPFAVKPPPPPAPVPPDFSHVAYAAPLLFSPIPVQGGLLSLSIGDGTLTALSVSGQVIHLTPKGQILSKYPLPKTYAPPPNTVGAPPVPISVSPVAPLHWASDRQGDLYITDARHRTLNKYAPNGNCCGRLLSAT